MAAIDSGIYDCLQIAYSPLDRRPEGSVFAHAAEAGVGLIIRSVLLRGAISARYRDLPATYADLQTAIARLDLLGLPLPELAYRYVLSETRLTTTLVGTAHREELDQVLRYAELGPLPDEMQGHIRQEPLLAEQWLNPGRWPSG